MSLALKLYFRVDCEDSRRIRAFLLAQGIRPWSLEVEREPLTTRQLRQLSARATVHDLLRMDHPWIQQGRIRVEGLDAEGVLQLLAVHPRLLRTPILDGMRGLAIGGNPDAWSRVVEEARSIELPPRIAPTPPSPPPKPTPAKKPQGEGGPGAKQAGTTASKKSPAVSTAADAKEQ